MYSFENSTQWAKRVSGSDTVFFETVFLDPIRYFDFQNVIYLSSINPNKVMENKIQHVILFNTIFDEIIGLNLPKKTTVY